MEKTRVEDESPHTVSTESKRQKIYKSLEKYKADSSEILKNLHDHLDMVESDIEKRSYEIKEKENELRVMNIKLMETQKEIEERTKEVEEKMLEIKAAEIEAGDKAKELDLLRNHIKSEEKTLNELRKSVKNAEIELESRNKELRQMSSVQQIEQQTNEAEENTRLNLVRNQIKSEEKTLIELRKSVKRTQSELELKKKELRLMSSVLVKHEQQPVAAETELSNGDDIVLREISSASLGRHDVSSYLRAISNPAKFVLDLAEKEIRDAYYRQESCLQDSKVEKLILFFEELAEIGGSYNPQMQLKATQVATLWKGKIIIEAPQSSLEALAFLLFIVVYRLKSLINEEETALLVTSVSHYKQGPKLFHSLGLELKIPDFVNGLVRDRQYIPAVRLICLFKLKDFSASTLLMKEISCLRRSALEKAENKDVGRLRAIVELVADYKLDIDIPGDLIAKLMFKKQNSAPPKLHCSVEESNKTSQDLVAVTRSSGVDLLVPKRETKPFVNPSANGCF